MSRLTAVIARGLLPAMLLVASPALGQEREVLQQINDIVSQRASEAKMSYRVLFDAALDLSEAPSATGGADPWFNLNTIHSGMEEWDVTRDWAESNPAMAEAILQCRDKLVFGMPYGDAVDTKYSTNGMYANIAVDGNLREQDFGYLGVIDTVAAFSTAECYRLLEAGQSQRAVDLATAQIYINDQLCDRLFLTEKLHAIELQRDFLECVRDMIHTHFDRFTIEQLASESYGDDKKGLSFELPWLRTDLLEMPVGDRYVASAMINSVFGEDEAADPMRFADVFAQIQAQEAPFTQFGAAHRWRRVAAFHASRKATLDRLQLVYDDWDRRWHVRAWHEILNISPQYNRLNPVRYAAVIYALRDINEIFDMRRQLVAAVNGTTYAAALAAYRKEFGTYPDDLEKAYATFVQKRFDADPFDKDGGGFGYRQLFSPLDLVADGYDDFVTVEECLLWSRGQDFESQRGEEHSRDGLIGDIVYWPPVRAVAREQGIAP